MKKKIWIDLTNSPHINFFKPFLKKWEDEGYEIILTVRDLANTIELVNHNGWSYTEIGSHAGKNKLLKIFYFPVRVISLYFFLKKKKPDIGISHSSFYSPFVCKLLKIPSIYLNDNENAKGNRISFKFATLNMLPESLSNKASQLNWTHKYNIDFYPGIKEGIYLSQREFKLNNLENHLFKSKIFIRLEPWTAEYYNGENEFMDPFIQKLSTKFEVVILPRSKSQNKHFNQKKFKAITVSDNIISLEKIKQDCIVFIGAGGSMTRELALLGVPTLSVYQDKLLSVDKYLINLGLMKYNPMPQVVDIENMINDQNLNTVLFEKGNEAFKLIDKKLNQLLK